MSMPASHAANATAVPRWLVWVQVVVMAAVAVVAVVAVEAVEAVAGDHQQWHARLEAGRVDYADGDAAGVRCAFAADLECPRHAAAWQSMAQA